MADKEHVKELGTGAAIALRLTGPWAHSVRIVILDSGFASLKAAKALAEVELYIFGNVTTAQQWFSQKVAQGEIVLVRLIHLLCMVGRWKLWLQQTKINSLCP